MTVVKNKKIENRVVSVSNKQKTFFFNPNRDFIWVSCKTHVGCSDRKRVPEKKEPPFLYLFGPLFLRVSFFFYRQDRTLILLEKYAPSAKPNLQTPIFSTTRFIAEKRQTAKLQFFVERPGIPQYFFGCPFFVIVGAFFFTSVGNFFYAPPPSPKWGKTPKKGTKTNTKDLLLFWTPRKLLKKKKQCFSSWFS